MKHTYHIVLLIDEWFPVHGSVRGEFGGMQVHVKRLYDSLVKSTNFHVTLLYPSFSTPLAKWLYCLLGLFQLIRLNRQEPIHCVHAHGPHATLAAGLFRWLYRIPAVSTIHSLHHLANSFPLPSHMFHKLAYQLMPLDQHIRLIANPELMPITNAASTYIPNGISVREFDQVITSKAQVPTLIWVGSDHASKGLEFLRKAIVKVRRVIPTLETHLVTGGELVGQDLIRAYKQAHVFVLSSLSETMPLSLLEAWAAKLPVVATRTGQMGELIESHKNGILVEPGNTRQLAKAILTLLRARIVDQHMAQAGYEFVKANFSWTKTIRSTTSLYRQLIDTTASVQPTKVDSRSDTRYMWPTVVRK